MTIEIRGNIVTPGGILPGGALIIENTGLIEEIVPARTPRRRAPSAAPIDFGNKWVVPGFVDLHVHGGGGADFMDGTPEAARQVARTHARHGTTTLLATTLTGSRETIVRCLQAAVEVQNTPGPDEARIAGAHLEGPYLCAARRGAQPEQYIRPPDWDEMQAWMRIGGGSFVKKITLAPEIDGALEFIGKAAEAGVASSLGHTNATYEQAIAATDAGASQVTHLFNAMTPLTHRSPGMVGASLADSRLLLELIADGVHVHPTVVQLAIQSAGAERIALITDAMSGASMPDGTYQLGGNPVVVRNGAATFEDGLTLAGSVLTMNRAFMNVQRYAGVTPQVAARMASANAARALGLDAETGRLEPGLRADLAVVDPQTGAVEATMRDGKWIWRT